MPRISYAKRIAAWQLECAAAVQEINSQLQTLSEKERTIKTAFGAATIYSIVWMPATIGGTMGHYKMESGSTRCFVTDEHLWASLTGVHIPPYPRKESK